jgi:hypothetical protein
MTDYRGFLVSESGLRISFNLNDVLGKDDAFSGKDRKEELP